MSREREKSNRGSSNNPDIYLEKKRKKRQQDRTRRVKSVAVVVVAKNRRHIRRIFSFSSLAFYSFFYFSIDGKTAGKGKEKKEKFLCSSRIFFFDVCHRVEFSDRREERRGKTSFWHQTKAQSLTERKTRAIATCHWWWWWEEIHWKWLNQATKRALIFSEREKSPSAWDQRRQNTVEQLHRIVNLSSTGRWQILFAAQANDSVTYLVIRMKKTLGVVRFSADVAKRKWTQQIPEDTPFSRRISTRSINALWDHLVFGIPSLHRTKTKEGQFSLRCGCVNIFFSFLVYNNNNKIIMFNKNTSNDSQ